MNNLKLVSVLIPCYNGSKYINRCLESCIKQTYKNIEIIIIDDGSTDESYRLLSEWSKKNSNIKIYHQTNRGLAYTRNKLISLTKGYYFFFLDIDDIIANNAIEKLINNSNNFKCDLVVGRTKIWFQNHKAKLPFIPSWRYTKNMTKGHYIKSNICPPWGCIIKTSFFKELKVKFIDYRIFEDIGVMTYVYLKTENFKAIKDIVYYYYQHKNNKLNGNDKQLSDFKLQCYKKINDLYFQTKQILDLLNKEKLFITKEYKRYINGLFFQIVPSNIFLTKNFSKEKDINYLLRYNLMNLIYRNNFNINFSKTPWKSLTYLYILSNNKKIIKNIKLKQCYHKWIIGKCCDYNKQKYIKKYNIIKINNDMNLTKLNNKNIYEIDSNLINKNWLSKIDDNKHLLFNFRNISLLNKDIIDTIYKKNHICFINWSNNFKTINNFQILKEIFVGFVFDIDEFNNIKNLDKILNKINNNQDKRLIIIKAKSLDNIKLKQIKNKVDRIYIK